MTELATMTLPDLEHREQIIRVGKQSFIAVGTALAEIRDLKGYKLRDYSTFEAYCQGEFQIERTNAYKYIGAAQVVDVLPAEMSTRVDISQARELARLVKQNPNGNRDKRRKEIDVEAVQEIAQGIEFGKTTVKQVAAAVDAKLKAQKREVKESDLNRKANYWTTAFGAEWTFQPTGLPKLTIICRDSTNLKKHIPDASVPLVVISPPYNQGIKYRKHDDNMKPAAYKGMVCGILRESFRILEPGGRIAIVVPAGVNRDPYIPFASMFQQWLIEVGFTLFGEVVWDKGARVVGGSTAFGSFRSAAAPRFRDRTERIEFAYKQLPKLRIPKQFLLQDEKGTFTPFLQDARKFLDLVQDVWHGPPEIAERVGHPAPFPVWLAENCIRLLAYPTATIADLCGGSGSTAVAAKRLGCNAIHVDLDPAYCTLALERWDRGK